MRGKRKRVARTKCVQQPILHSAWPQCCEVLKIQVRGLSPRIALRTKGDLMALSAAAVAILFVHTVVVVTVVVVTVVVVIDAVVLRVVNDPISVACDAVIVGRIGNIRCVRYLNGLGSVACFAGGRRSMR